MSSDRGFALIEALVAMAILAIAGLTMVRLATVTLDVTVRVGEVEKAQLDAQRLLIAHTLLSHRDLERGIGHRQEGPWQVVIAREDASVYGISLRHMTLPVTLATSVYRPASRDERAE